MNDSTPATAPQPSAYYRRRHYSATEVLDLNRNEGEQPKIYRRRYRMDEVLDVPVNVPCGWNPKDCL